MIKEEHTGLRLATFLLGGTPWCHSASSPVVVHAARDPPSRDHVPVPAADGGGALNVAPHLIHSTILADDATDPAVQRTVYDVTVIFRATARLGPTRLQYFVVPAAAATPNSGGADRELDAVDLFLILPGSFLGAFVGAMVGVVFVHKGRGLGEDKDGESSGDGTFLIKNPEAARAQAGVAKAARGGN